MFRERAEISGKGYHKTTQIKKTLLSYFVRKCVFF